MSFRASVSQRRRVTGGGSIPFDSVVALADGTQVAVQRPSFEVYVYSSAAIRFVGRVEPEDIPDGFWRNAYPTGYTTPMIATGGAYGGQPYYPWQNGSTTLPGSGRITVTFHDYWTSAQIGEPITFG